MNFFKIFISVCSGTKIFPRLLYVPLLRAFWHMLLLALICALIITAGKSFYVYEEVSNVSNWLTEHFLRIKVENNQIIPAKNVEPQFGALITRDSRVDYFPKGELSLKKLENQDTTFGLIWSPGLMSFWMQLKPNVLYSLPLIYPFRESIDKIPLQNTFSSPEEMQKYLSKFALPDSQSSHFCFFVPLIKMGYPMTEFKWIGSFFVGVVMLIVFLWSSFLIISSTLLFTSIFSTIYFILGKDSISRLNLQKLFVIGIYTGFPAMVVASLFPALNLPLFDYQTVYLVGFLGYMFAVFSRIQKTLEPEKKNEADDVY